MTKTISDLISEKGSKKDKALPVDRPNPTSFGELEAQEAEEAKAAAVETLAIDFRRLTENVLSSVDPASASAELRRLSQELGARIAQATAEPKAANKSLGEMVLEGMRAQRGEQPKREALMTAKGKSLEEVLFPRTTKTKAGPELRRMSFGESLAFGLTNPDGFLEHRKEMQRSAALRSALANDLQKVIDEFSRTARKMISDGSAFAGSGSFHRALDDFSRRCEELVGLG
jgi:hypothetical protein